MIYTKVTFERQTANGKRQMFIYTICITINVLHITERERQKDTLKRNRTHISSISVKFQTFVVVVAKWCCVLIFAKNMIKCLIKRSLLDDVYL